MWELVSDNTIRYIISRFTITTHLPSSLCSHRVVEAGELALMKRPMSAGGAGGALRTSAASRTFETAESVARYLGPQTIQTPGTGKKKIVLGSGGGSKNNQRPSSAAFGLGKGGGAGGGERKKERPKTATARLGGRLSRITAKVRRAREATSEARMYSQGLVIDEFFSNTTLCGTAYFDAG